MLHLKVIGPLTLSTSEGAQIRVQSQRGAAILGILAIAPENRRSKKWIQDILWPDRQPEQASASLRQELRRLRLVLETKEALLSEGRTLSLNCQHILIDLEAELKSRLEKKEEVAEFLEGLSINSPKFEGWIDDHRSKITKRLIQLRSPNTSNQPLMIGHRFPTVLLELKAGHNDRSLVFGEMFNDLISRGINELGPVDIKVEKDGSEQRRDHDDRTADKVRIRTTSLSGDMEQALRLGIVETQTLNMLWSGNWIDKVRKDQIAINQDTLLQFAFQSQEAAIDAMIEAEELDEEMHSALLGFRARDAIFSMDPEELKVADADLKTAFNVHKKGIFLAWRAFIRANMMVENDAMTSQRLKAEAEQLITNALQLDARNGTVSAIAAHVMLLLNASPEIVEDLAKFATRVNPSNPLGWSSLANVAMVFDKYKQAKEISSKALLIARNSKHRFWWEMNAAVMSALLGDFEQARTHSLVANSLSPNFKPPLRYLTAINQHFEDHESNKPVIERMRRLEPDFEPEAMKEGDYPTGILRKSGLVG